MKKIVFSLSVIALAFSSCDKLEPIDASYHKALIDGKWTVVGIKENANINVEGGGVYIDIYPQLPGCDKDDYLNFSTTNAVAKYDNVVKCVLSNPDSINYTYDLQNEKYIKLYTDPANIANTTYREGDFKLYTTDSFTIDYRRNGTIEGTTISTIYSYTKSK